MKNRYLYFYAALCVGYHLGFADDTALLSPEKQTILIQERHIIDAENEKLRTNWIAPLYLNGAYTTDKSTLANLRSDTQKVSASISQDIFRSGGIAYQISYANAKKQSDTILLQRQIAILNQQLSLALLNLKKNSYQHEQSTKRLSNKEIEIFIKRQLYDAGKVDITELNNALMEKSLELKSNIAYKYLEQEQRHEITKISDINPDTFVLPAFELVKKEEYLDAEFSLRYAQAQSDTLKNLYDVTRTNYLPSIALNGTVGYQNYDPRIEAGSYRGDYYSAGASITLPLVYNASATLQESKAAYLKEVANTADKGRELEINYLIYLDKIESYQNYIAITTQNLSLYDELIGAIQAGVNAGTKTGYDLQMLQNSRTIEELEIKIQEINIQIELAKLYFSLKPSKDSL